MVLDPAAAQRLVGVGAVVVVGALASLVARRLRQPTVVGFLVGGLVAGPVLGLIRPDPLLEALGELGIALLLFLVGIDMSVREARAVGPPALVAGLAQIGGSAAAGWGVALLLGIPAKAAAFVGFALAFSSTVVVVKVLMDMGELGSTHGRLAVGILLVQDAVVILFLTVLPALGAGEGLGEPARLALDVGIALAKMALVAGVALLASRTLLPRAFRWAARAPTLTFLLGLTWLFLGLAASHALHLSAEVGAFLAGLSLAPLPYSGELRRRTRPLLDLFVALFFVSLAAGLDLSRAAEVVPAALALSAVVLLTHALLPAAALVLMRYSREASVRAGATLGQVSEFSIVLATLALGQGLVEESARDLVVLVALVTIAASGLLLWRSRDIARALDRLTWWKRLPPPTRGVEEEGDALEGHIVLVGWGRLSARIAGALQRTGARVVAITAEGTRSDPRVEGVEERYGDPQDPAAASGAGLAKARLVVVHVEDPDVARALAGEEEAPPVMALADREEDARRLEAHGVRVVHPARLLAEEAARAARGEALDG